MVFCYLQAGLAAIWTAECVLLPEIRHGRKPFLWSRKLIRLFVDHLGQLVYFSEKEKHIKSIKNTKGMSETNWYVVTGAPSSGKTALVRELEKLGYRVIHEMARAYIETQMEQGRTLEEIRADKRSFENWILHAKIAIEAELPKDQVIIFDRAIPDSIAYFEVASFDAKDAIGKSPRNRYKKVFLLDRLSYEVDHARIEDSQIAVKLEQSLEQSYKMLGYEIMRVNVMPIGERVKVIVDQIEKE